MRASTLLLASALLIPLLGLGAKLAADRYMRFTELGPGPHTMSAEEIRAQLSGKNVLVVGGTAGLGRALAEQAARHGARVTVVGRRDPGGLHPEISLLQADLSTLKAAQELARTKLDAKALDVVVITAGIFSGPERRTNSEGIEIDLAVSSLASRYVLLNELMPGMRPETRVFVMGFPGEPSIKIADLDDLNSEKSYDQMAVHLGTVAVNEALVLETAKNKRGILVFGLNPGLIQTDIRQYAFGQGMLSSVVETVIGALFMSAEDYGAITIAHLASPEVAAMGGGTMFNQRGYRIAPNPWVLEHSAEVYEAAQALVKRVLG